MSRIYPCIYCTDDLHCTKYTDDNYESWCVLGPCQDEKPSNADRIRSMTDEELAELLRDTQCNSCAWQGNDCDYADDCKAEKLEMLKQECDDNGT